LEPAAARRTRPICSVAFASTPQFPDSEGLLKTAYADLSNFFAAGKVPHNGPS